jgi:hypothetical protein
MANTMDLTPDDELLLTALGLMPYYTKPFAGKSQAATVGAPNMEGPTNPKEEGGDSGSGVSSKGEPSAFGDAPSLSDALGGGIAGKIGGNVASKAADLGLSMATGLATSPVGGPLGAYGLMTSLGKAVRGWAGAPSFESNPLAGAPTVADIQNAMDMMGIPAGLEAQAMRDAAISLAGGLTPEFGGLTPADLAGNPGGWGSNTLGAPTPGVANPDSPFGAGPRGFGEAPRGSEYGTNMGNTGGGNGPGGKGGGGLSDSSGNPGGDSPGDHEAKGGVLKATHGPKRVTFGEAGPETAIYIPEWWLKTPGYQGKERQVKESMRRMMALMG